MQISNSLNRTNPYQGAPKLAQKPEQAGSSDSVTLGYNGAKEIALGAFAGAVPVVGAGVNFVAMIGAGVNRKDNLAMGNLAGAGANVAGTLSLAGGLLLGNSTATYVGLGLLGASGVTAGLTAAAL